ncbi:MAG: hypothetical protein ABIJ34_03365 [archaeon]
MSLTDKVCKIICISALSALALNTLMQPVTYISNLFKRDTQTVVFSSGSDSIPYPRLVNGFVDFFMYPPITLRENLNGSSVKWISHATREDILAALNDPTYENVIFVGHGTQGSYWAENGSLGAWEAEGVPKKDGYLIMQTCGNPTSPTFGDVLLIDGQKAYYLKPDVTVIGNYTSSVKRLLSNELSDIYNNP